VPGFHAAAQVVLVEASPVCARGRRKPCRARPCARPHGSTGSTICPKRPLFLVANEFLDALPIRQFLRGPMAGRNGWSACAEPGLTFGLSAPLPQVPDTPAFRHAPGGALVEDCLPARHDRRRGPPASRAGGGLALFIDYGGWRSQGDTLQALRAMPLTTRLPIPARPT
jgi:NADH dehydrogenase [ubiquinone] 1 alpha subcomplex assembly factor 7